MQSLRDIVTPTNVELFLKYMEEQRDRQMGVDFSLIDTSNGRRQT